VAVVPVLAHPHVVAVNVSVTMNSDGRIVCPPRCDWFRFPVRVG
jgi:hypothetical protein